MTEKEDLRIVDLNDDCLIEIFKCLKTTDLFSVFEAHKRFKQPVIKVVSVKCVIVELRDSRKIDEAFFEKFGDQIRKLHISNNSEAVDRCSQCREFIGKYFHGGNLESLIFENFELTEAFIESNANMFKSLTSFKIGYMEISECKYEKLFNVLVNVEDLDLQNYWFVDKKQSPDVVPMICALRHLKKLKLRVRSTKNIDRVPINTGVRELSIHLALPADVPIISRFPNLVTLNLSIARKCDYRFSGMPRIPTLKHVSILFHNEFFVEPYFLKLADPNTLETLDLQAKEMDVNIWEALYQITNLCRLNLKLKKCINVDFLEIATKLKKLRSISIDEVGLIGHLDIERICRFVQLAENVEFMRIRIAGGYRSFCDKLTEIRKNQSSKAVLRVEIVNRFCQRSAYLEHNCWVQVAVIKDV